MKTTLNDIEQHYPNNTIRQKLSLYNSTDYIDFMTLKEILGIKDAIWCLRTQDYEDYCLFLADIAESIIYIFENEYPDNKIPRQTINAIRKWHSRDITSNQLKTFIMYAATAVYATSDAAYNAAAAASTAINHYNCTATCTSAYVVAAAGTLNISKDDSGYDGYAAFTAWENIDKLFIKHFGDNENVDYPKSNRKV